MRVFVARSRFYVNANITGRAGRDACNPASRIAMRGTREEVRGCDSRQWA